MAKNYAGTGMTVDFIAPTAGAFAGVPLVLNDMVVIPTSTGTKGAKMVGITAEEWRLPVDGALKLGQKVNVLAGVLVAPAVADSVPFGKLTSDPSGGFATALLIQ
ncbi:hypothetical protein LOY38_19570 [Pseudomonas sp. B21-015]|uniref:hypothetical protein n=1 Tax=Pseudomonas sp. B21-015 TaxID=2895473 RepID=UPI00215F3E21|nr:hypothetical protein [Pseudomonas sp. B21-015]UVM48569.1 hypothetical protein LOY38_19570 [Pseudomonas sp. B21-015]